MRDRNDFEILSFASVYIVQDFSDRYEFQFSWILFVMFFNKIIHT